LKLRKELEQRIHGWFPKEPNLPKQPTQSSQKEANRQMLIQPQNKGPVSTTDLPITPLYGIAGLLWIFLIDFLQISRIFAYSYLIPWDLNILVVMLGGVFGVAVGGVVAHFELGVLAKKGEFTGRDSALFLVGLIGAAVIFLFALQYAPVEVSLQTQQLMQEFAFLVIPAMAFTIFGLFLRWERKNKRTIYSRFWGGAYVFPKMDNSQVKS